MIILFMIYLYRYVNNLYCSNRIVRNSRKCYPRAKARGATHFLKKRVSAMPRDESYLRVKTGSVASSRLHN